MNYRNQLPQTLDKTCLTDGGLETVMIYQEGIDLPNFASYTLLEREDARDILQRYFQPYIEIARKHRLGLQLESVTWRANTDWGATLGHDQKQLDRINAQAILELELLREAAETEGTPMPISGCIGPRGDGYVPGALMTPAESARYHGAQIRILADTAADLVSALTLSYSDEAIGILQAAEHHEIPAVISFTLETDGKLPSGEGLGEAIIRCDAESGRYASYYMINCAHPTHFQDVLQNRAPWLDRIGGLRANASSLSHEELDQSTELDAGNPVEFGQQYQDLRQMLPNLNTLGGCCGTDHNHIGAICESCFPVASSQA